MPPSALPHTLEAESAGLPLRLKLLAITAAAGGGAWLAEAFAADGAANVALSEAVGVAGGLARLRDEAYDAVLVSHDPGMLDALEFAAAFRAAGNDDPLILLGTEPPPDVEALAYESGADDYSCITQTTVRGLLWKLARAIRRCQLARENRRLIQAERQRLQQEHHEAERLLDQQRAVLTDLESLSEGPAAELLASAPSPAGGRLSVAGGTVHDSPTAAAGRAMPASAKAAALPPLLVDHYRELLRAYVIMGAGNLAGEMTALALLLVESRVSAQHTMQLHVQVLGELVDGLGNRSARHVMNRADLLALEVLSHLADGYRQRAHEHRTPVRQLALPGFAA
ncbi:MAG TPA: hypothetical protein VEQ85_04140 [Lacipirellulaceae bacterium]|nr:hypothetical protein [Lacipirellulaceae bacterium]